MNASRTLTRATSVIVSALVLGLVGCGPAGTTDPFEQEEVLEFSDNPIRNPTSIASMYPGSALINMNGSLCSGSVIAPRVVLTAGHCVENQRSFTITTPYAKETNGQPQTRYATGKWTTYKSVNPTLVNPNTPDVGLLFVDQPFQLPTWPRVSSATHYGSQAVNVGRINHGSTSYSNLYVGMPLTLRTMYGYPYSYGYSTTGVTEQGDSGGPMFLAGTHTIVGVCSGSGVAARMDAVFSQIDQLVRSNGGWGTVSTTPSDPPPTTDPSSCVGEQPGNDDPNSAQRIYPGRVCGTLSSSFDEDWYTFSANTGYRYNIRVQGQGVTGQMWKCMDHGCYSLQTQAPSQYAGTVNGAGTYYLGVWSNNGTVGPYTIDFTN